MGEYQDEADRLRETQQLNTVTLQTQIGRMPDYGSQVAGMAGGMSRAGTRMEELVVRAQSQLGMLNRQIPGAK